MGKIYVGLVSFIISLLNLQISHADIILNEMMPCNVSTEMNEYNNYTGWVELYNSGTQEVNIQGYTFENIYYNKSGEQKSNTWTVTASIRVPANGYILLFFDEEPGDAHATYKIETSEGYLNLYDNLGVKIDYFLYYTMFPHVSWGKDGENRRQGYMEKPTPRGANANCMGGSVQRAQKPVLSPAPGLYNNSGSISVTLTSDYGTTIYYTTDGSEPTENSTLYQSSIFLDKTTVIRARAYDNSRILSEIATGTYVFKKDIKSAEYHTSCGGFTVPIVSISTNKDNFFGSQMGIYVVGSNGISSGKSCDMQVANYNQDWKRPVNFEYIVNGEQVVSQELDAAVMGGCSRQYQQKSLKLTASKKLGNNKINYDFFADKPGMEYKSLQLRNGGNDYDYHRVRDGFMQTLIQGRMNIDYQSYQPVAFYINGEYWGHVDLRERTNKDFVFSNYGLDEEDIDLLEIGGKEGSAQLGYFSASTGTTDAYEELLVAAQQGTDSPAYYEKMSRLMDMDEYIDYQIFEQYIVNTDWPGNNTKIWREKNTGRFRWIVYDTDFGFGLYGDGYPNYTSYNTNMLEFCIDRNPGNFSNEAEWMVLLFSNLMKNETFRQKFLNKALLHLGTTFEPQRVLGILSTVKKNAKDEICAHRKRFSSDWWSDGGELENFGNKRTDIMYGHIKGYYNSEYGTNMGSSVNLTINSNISGADFLLNGERMNTSSYTGKYFENMNLEVKPIAPPGYKFESWNHVSSTVSQAILSSATEWKYYYEGDQPAGEWASPGYNDSDWQTGSGKFGYADNRTYDVGLDYGSDPNNKYLTAYFRSTFNVEDLNSINEVEATLLYDDGVIIYINGTELFRYNMPEGTVTYETVANTYVNDDEKKFNIPVSYLHTGINTIAVEVHQDKPTSSDLTFRLNANGKINMSGTSNTIFSTTVTGDLELTATFISTGYVKPSVVINELCTSNNSASGFSNEYGVYADWIEVYNAGDQPVDLGGMYLTDDPQVLADPATRAKYQLPTHSPFETTVMPGEYKIIWADKEIWQGALHTNFKLSATTQSTVVLAQMVNGQMQDVDRVTYTLHDANESYGRVTDGGEDWTVFTYCPHLDVYLTTPGEANDSKDCVPDPVSTDDIFAGEGMVMKLYPNPATAAVNVAVNTSSPYAIQVYDNQGRMVEHISNVTERVETLNVGKYPSGVYIVRVVTAETVLQQKFIKY